LPGVQHQRLGGEVAVHLHVVALFQFPCPTTSQNVTTSCFLDCHRAHFTVFTCNAFRRLAVMEPQVGEKA